MQNFGVTNKEHYGMLWYFLEWPIKTSNTFIAKTSREGRKGVAVRIEGNRPKGRNMIQRKNILNLTGKKCISNKQESAWPRVEPEPSFDS